MPLSIKIRLPSKIQSTFPRSLLFLLIQNILPSLFLALKKKIPLLQPRGEEFGLVLYEKVSKIRI